MLARTLCVSVNVDSYVTGVLRIVYAGSLVG